MIEGKHLGSLKLMPAKEGTCPICATEHDPAFPHNAQSMFYQYNFYNDYGVWPNWGDAMVHCTPEMQETWRAGLMERGVTADKLVPAFLPPIALDSAETVAACGEGPDIFETSEAARICSTCWESIEGNLDALPATMGKANCSECGELADCYEVTD